jgi:hypothetical protein
VLIKSSNRKEAYTAVLNQLLRDNRLYCNNCGEPWRNKVCCEDPQIGTNADVAKAVAAQCKFQRENAQNAYACTKGKHIRFGISLPPFMYEALDNYEKLHGRRLMRTKEDVYWLARNFPMFAIPERI